MASKKSNWMGLRIAPDEKAALHSLAKSHGLTLSRFIRGLPEIFEHKKTA